MQDEKNKSSDFSGLCEYFKENGVDTLDIKKIAEGMQSCVYMVITGNQKYALKKFKRKYSSNTLESIKNEYDILSVFYAYTLKNSLANISSPEPLMLFEKDFSYLMEYKSEYKLRENIPNNITDRLLAVSNILNGLEAFHNATGDIYGDFHAENILVSKDNSIVFIDVTTPVEFHNNQKFKDLKYPLQVMDVGYFVFSSCVNFHKNFLDSPRSAFRLIVFTKLLVKESSSFYSNGDHEFVKSLEYVCFSHLERLKNTSGKGYIIAMYTNIFLRYVFG